VDRAVTASRGKRGGDGRMRGRKRGGERSIGDRF